MVFLKVGVINLDAYDAYLLIKKLDELIPREEEIYDPVVLYVLLQ